MTVSATGTVSAVTTVQVGSQVSGIVSKLYADFNSQVKKGQLLAELDPTPFLQQVEQQKANVTKSQVDVANTQVTYGRQKRLADVGLIAQSDFDAAKAAYDGARASLALAQASLHQAETNLGYTKIYSPIDGQVVARQYDVGQTVAASFSAPTLFTIAQDLTKMQVQADVDQSDIGQIKVGEVARFNVDAYPDQEFRGQISQVRLNATVTQNVITYPVIIEVPNPDGKLRPSMTANVTVEVATVHDVLRVPNAALRFKPAIPVGKGGGGQRASGGAGAGATPAAARAAVPAGVGRRAPAPAADRRAGSFEPCRRRPRRGRSRQRLLPAAPAAPGTARTGRGRPSTCSATRTCCARSGSAPASATATTPRWCSGQLKPGDKVITGVATLKVQGPANPGSPGGGAPRMGGRF